jgi:cysteine desulfurase
LHLDEQSETGWAGKRASYMGIARFSTIEHAVSQRPRIYLDHAATTPILPAAKAAMAEAMERWANPSSPHAEGRAARAALEDARERIKRALGWTGELIFTSGATEGIEIAIGRTDRRVLVSPVEHEAVFRAAPDADILPLAKRQQVSTDALEAALRKGPPPVVAIQHVNSETGVVQPVDQYARQVREAGGILVSDCSQSAGKVHLPDADILIVAAHKLGGPPGIGALLARDLKMLSARGGQEFGYRGGTQNLPAAFGFAAALEQFDIREFPFSLPGAPPIVSWLVPLLQSFRDLEFDLYQVGGGFQPSAISPDDFPLTCGWILALTLPGMSSVAQLIQLDSAGFAVSAGSACSSGSMKPSRVLRAFGVSEDEAKCTIRVSFGWSTTPSEIEEFFGRWFELASEVRSRAA